MKFGSFVKEIPAVRRSDMIWKGNKGNSKILT